MVLFRRYTKFLELAKLSLIIALIRVLEKISGERFENGVILDR
jgi:hypothetical protein